MTTETKITVELTSEQAAILYDNIYERLLEEEDMDAPLNTIGEAFADFCQQLNKQGISR